MFSLDGMTALVTGASGGIGGAIARQLHAQGAAVVLSGTRADALAAVAAELGERCFTVACNLSDSAAVDGLIAAAEAAAGAPIDILVANAGVLRDKAFNNMSMEDFEFVMKVHLMGTVYCTKAAWPIMRERKYGRIVVTTSGSGTVGNFGQANYGAAKMALNGFINVLRTEGAKYNIMLNAISPSARTRMTETLLPEWVLNFMRPELVSPAVAYMASEQCTMSGEIISATAGSFSRVKYIQSEGVQFDPDQPVTPEMFEDNFDKIMDISTPQPHGMSLQRLEARLRAMGKLK